MTTATFATAPSTTDQPRQRGDLLKRNLALVAIVGMIIAVAVNGILDFDLPDDKTAALRQISAHRTKTVVSLLAFVAIQLTSVGAFLGLGRLLNARSPRLGVIGALLTVLGAFGHTVYTGLTLMIILMSTDPAHTDTYASLLGRMNTTPYIGAFALLGLAGVVAGTLVGSIGVFRAHLGPRWLAPLLWAWLLLEFVGSSVAGWLEYVAIVAAAVAWIMIIREMVPSVPRPRSRRAPAPRPAR